MPLFAVASAAGRDACDRFRATNTAYPVTHGFVHDPASINRDALIEAGVITEDNRYDSWQLARALCHVAIWRRCAAEQETCHVADDRAVIRTDFTTAILPHTAEPDFDIVVWGVDLREPAWLGYAPGVEGRLLFDQSRQLPDAEAFQRGHAGSLRFQLLHCADPNGYTVSPAGAARLLASCLPFGAAVLPYFREPNIVFPNGAFDREMARQYAAMRAFIVQPLLSMVVEPAHPGIITDHFVKAFQGLAGQPALCFTDQPVAASR